MQEVTYSELKNLRDNGELIPGLSYRITDYDCMTFQPGTRSAHNQFDIIVTADSSTVLNENARAINHKIEIQEDVNTTRMNLHYGSTREICISVNGTNVWAILMNTEDDSYYWYDGVHEKIVSKAREGYNPIRASVEGVYYDVVDYKNIQINIENVDLCGQYTGHTQDIDGQTYYVFDLGESNKASILTRLDSNCNPYYETDESYGLDIRDNLVYFTSLEPSSPSDMYFYYNDGEFICVQDFIDEYRSMIARREFAFGDYSFENTLEPYISKDYFGESNLSKWELKYALDDGDNKYAWIHANGESGRDVRFGVDVMLNPPNRSKSVSSEQNDSIKIKAYRFDDGSKYGSYDRHSPKDVVTNYAKRYEMKESDVQLMSWYTEIENYIHSHRYDKDVVLYGYAVNSNELPPELRPSIFVGMVDKGKACYEHEYCYTVLPPEYFVSPDGTYTLSLEDVIWRFDAENEYADDTKTKSNRRDGASQSLFEMLRSKRKPLISDEDSDVSTNDENNVELRRGEEPANNDNNEELHNTSVDDILRRMTTARRLRSEFFGSLFHREENANRDVTIREDTNDNEPDSRLTTIDFMSESLYAVEDTWEAREATMEDEVRGVIYYMKDEFNNEAPYDFKNIMFERIWIGSVDAYLLGYTGGDIVQSILNNFSNCFPLFGIESDDYIEGCPYCTYRNSQAADFYYYDTFYAYTFTRMVYDDNIEYISDIKFLDATLKKAITYDRQYDEYLMNFVCGNVIKPCMSAYAFYDNTLSQGLNNITFISPYEALLCDGNIFEVECTNNSFGDYCNYNKFGSACRNNIASDYFENNSFGNICENNLFNMNCYCNDFKNECNNNVFGENCHDITINNQSGGNYFERCYNITGGNSFSDNVVNRDSRDNIFGDACKQNVFNATCRYITFDSYCSSNVFGTYCLSNSLGNSCNSNSFGNFCERNSLGNGCQNNSFGNNCYSNSFGNGCFSNGFGNECKNNSFGNGCQNNTFDSSCINNTFDSSCYSNTFGNGCNCNSFSSDCYNNMFVSGCMGNSFGYGCSANTFGDNCRNNTLGSSCYSNTFGSNCNRNILNNNCGVNTLGNSCLNDTFDSSSCSNTLDHDCQCNSFGECCSSNTFGSSCYCNTFGSNCVNNSFGENCQNNTFSNCCINNSFGDTSQNNALGSNCYNNTFTSASMFNRLGNGCYFNSFNNCIANSFGNYCHYNSLGSCVANSFGNDCGNNLFTPDKHGFSNGTIFDGVSNCEFVNNDADYDIKNFHVLNGVDGSDGNGGRNTYYFTPNLMTTQVLYYDSSTDTNVIGTYSFSSL